jgi:hypothetical protein
MGKVLMINNEEKKVGVFGIEEITAQHDSSIVYELFLTDLELNDFIYALTKLIPSSLCLSSQELIVFQKASKETLKTIQLFREEKNCQQFVTTQSKLQKELNNVSVYNLSTFLLYYCEIILVFHKFKTLHNRDLRFDNIDSIITQI